MAEMQDIQLPCGQEGCGETFTFEVGEQKFFAAKGFNPPRYCTKHRAERKAAREERERKAVEAKEASDAVPMSDSQMLA